MHGDEARGRNRLFKLISPAVRELEEKRVALLKKLAFKDEGGKPKMKEDGITFDMTLEVEKEFREKMAVTNSEEIELEVEVWEMGMVRSMLTEFGRNHMFDPQEGAAYDEILGIFEKS